MKTAWLLASRWRCALRQRLYRTRQVPARCLEERQGPEVLVVVTLRCKVVVEAVPRRMVVVVAVPRRWSWNLHRVQKR